MSGHFSWTTAVLDNATQRVAVYNPWPLWQARNLSHLGKFYILYKSFHIQSRVTQIIIVASYTMLKSVT